MIDMIQGFGYSRSLADFDLPVHRFNKKIQKSYHKDTSNAIISENKEDKLRIDLNKASKDETKIDEEITTLVPTVLLNSTKSIPYTTELNQFSLNIREK